MTGSLYLAWRYLLFERVKTLLLAGAITLALFIPAALRVLVSQSERQLTARAEATPLLIGSPGSPLELALNSLYFQSKTPPPLAYGEVDRVQASGLADPIPLHVKFHARRAPIVGTTLDYFEFRGLRIAQGQPLVRWGDCVLGARVAADRGLRPGDTVISSPENVFDLAGVYPLRMRVRGVLAFSDSPDDHAILTDLHTAWIMEGLAHGHEDLAAPDLAPAANGAEGNRLTANASVRQFQEVTDQNIDQFHFHGDPGTFPITAVIARPAGDTPAARRKSAALLQGRYLADGSGAQIIEPARVVGELLGTILTIQSYVMAALAGVGLGTLATAALVFMLSLRLRRREMETMMKIGGGRARLALVCAAEIMIVLLASAAAAAVLTALVIWRGEFFVRIFLG